MEAVRAPGLLYTLFTGLFQFWLFSLFCPLLSSTLASGQGVCAIMCSQQLSDFFLRNLLEQFSFCWMISVASFSGPAASFFSETQKEKMWEGMESRDPLFSAGWDWELVVRCSVR